MGRHFTLLATLALLSFGCAQQAKQPAQGEDASLQRWLDDELAPYLAQQLGQHPRFKGEPVILVRLDGADIQSDIDGLTRSVRDARLFYRVLSNDPLASLRPVAGCRLILPVDFPLGYRDAAIPRALAAAEKGLLDAGMRPARIAIGDVRRWHNTTARYLAWELMPVLERGLEAAIDRIGEGPHKLSGRAKDMGSAAVFISLWAVIMTWGLIGYERFLA